MKWYASGAKAWLKVDPLGNLFYGGVNGPFGSTTEVLGEGIPVDPNGSLQNVTEYEVGTATPVTYSPLIPAPQRSTGSEFRHRSRPRQPM